MKIRLLICWMLMLLGALVGVACQTQPQQIFIEVDDSRQSLTTEASTVREALAEAEVELEPLDRVRPDLYAQLEPGLTIVVTRVREEIELEREVVPFERNTVVNEALAPGETRLAQLGVNGEDEISIRVVYENGQEVSRTEVSRLTVTEPVPEILVVGPQRSLAPVRLEGTIAYLSNGNAWLMRNSSGSRRTLTSQGNLDGRVFSLSPNGRHLLYTTSLTEEIELPLNEMWLASTTIVGEPPVTTGLRGILHAHWSPVVTRPLIAYSTAERTPNPPGWQANNDLWLFAPPLDGQPAAGPFAEPVEIIEANTEGLYPWWGASFAWSPDGRRLAYARADQIGVISLTTTTPLSYSLTPLADFVPLQTLSDWVWVPDLSWSPDGRFIAATVHGPPVASESAEESQAFDLWLFNVDGDLAVQVVEEVGMWTNPAWGEAGIAFGQAVNPLQSVNSRYEIQLIDHDGSNRRQLFPLETEAGVQFPELVWGPAGERLLFVYNGNLYTVNRSGGVLRQLTSDTQASQPQWALAQAPTLTTTATLTATGTLTPTPNALTATPSPTATEPRPTSTRRASSTPTPPSTATLRPATATPTATPTTAPILDPVSPIATIPLDPE